jgi:DegV family protein with EDD domain
MSKVAIVTDSTAYIPEDICKQLNITVVPLVVIWGNETFVDGITINPKDFYTRLGTAKVMPTTSQATIIDMHRAFEKLVGEGYEVLGIFLSHKLSGTISSATQAREELGPAKDKITIFDSNVIAMALGFQAMLAARAAADGASVKDIVKMLEKVRPNSNVYFAVDTLEFLHRGGRIGGAQRFLGTALNLKPILTLEDGKVAGSERVRTLSKALDRIVELVAHQCEGKSRVHLATLHANAEENARLVMEKAQKVMNPVEVVFSEVSPVVGTHTGPGTVGLAYLAE